MKESADKIRETLPSEKKILFDEAMFVTMTSAAEQVDLENVDIDDIESVLAHNVKLLLDGKNADEIIENSNEIKRLSKIKHITQEINKLKDKKASAENYNRQLKEKFQIKNQVISLEKSYLFFKVHNNTNSDISKFHINIFLKNKKKPDQVFTQSTPIRMMNNDIASGHSIFLKVPITNVPEWIEMIKKSDEIDVNVTVTRLEDRLGYSIFKSYEFTEEDISRLADLNSELQNLSQG